MKPVNIPSGAQRNTEVGLVWREIFNGVGATTFELPFQNTFRVSAAADVTVRLDGVLAMTLRAGEVERFNTGAGLPDNDSSIVVVQIGAGGARVQVAEEKDPGRRTR